MLEPLVLEQPPDLDRPRPASSSCWRRRAAPPPAPSARRIAGTIASVRPGHSSRSWPTSAPTRNLKASNPALVAQPQHPRRLGLGRDVALHRRGVGPQPPRPPAEQLAPPACPRAVPRRSQTAVSKPAHRPREIRARKLVLALGHGVEQRVEVVAVLPEHPGRHLPVQHLRRDVGMVGRELAPALRARPRPSPGRSRRSRCRSSRSSRSACRRRPGPRAKPGSAGRGLAASDRSILDIGATPIPMLAPTVARGRDSSMTKHAGGALLPSIAIDRASATPLGAQLAARPARAHRRRGAAPRRPPAVEPHARRRPRAVAHHRRRRLRPADRRGADRQPRRRRRLRQRRARRRRAPGPAGRRPPAGPAGAPRRRGLRAVLPAPRPPGRAARLRHRHPGLRRLPDAALVAARRAGAARPACRR